MPASSSNAIEFVISGGTVHLLRFNTGTQTALFDKNIDVNGTTNLDAVDIDGAVDLAGDLTFTGGARAFFLQTTQLQPWKSRKAVMLT